MPPPTTSSVMSTTRSDVAKSEDSGPLSSLNRGRTPRGVSAKKFPLNVDIVDNFMKIVAYKEHKFESEMATDSAGGQANSSLNARRDIIDTILLPMPSGLATAYAQNYDDAGIGPVGASVAMNSSMEGFDRLQDNVRRATVAGNDFNAQTTRQSGRQALKKQFTGLSDSVKEQLKAGGLTNIALEGAENFAVAAGGIAGDQFGIPGVGALAGEMARRGVVGAQLGMGVARNPHMAVIYKTPNFRVFNFQWQLRPKDFQESIEIHKIIGALKFYSAPSYLAGSHVLKYPNQFGLSFKNNGLLYTMGTSVLRNFNVDYHGEGTPIYYDAPGGRRKLKAPAVVNISTEFQEISILTKESFEKAGR